MPGRCADETGSFRPRRRRGTRLILRPALLLLLAEGDSHGYQLMDHLNQMGIDSECLDSSVLYRDLREMEEMGLIQSTWDDDSKGPKKRVYQIREEGLARLSSWLESLDLVQRQIAALRSRYQELNRTGEDD